MKISAKILAVAALLILSMALLGAEAGGPAPANYSTQVSIAPLGTAGFVLQAQVKDIATGQIIAGPMLKLPSGEAGDTESTLETGETVALSATIDGGSRTANYTVTVKRGETLLSEHSAKVAL